MLEGYGLHELVWNMADQVVNDVFVASPADAEGRGIALSVRQAGAAADLTGASVYLVWRHRMTGKRGTEPFAAVDASDGSFEVFYPAAMQECGGVVDAQVMVSEGEGRFISTRTFQIRVEPVLVGELETQDGFTLFVGAIHAYENATGISTDAATAANAAAELANAAAGNADQAVADLKVAAESGEFDGADGKDGADGADGADGKDGRDGTDGKDGADGFSPIATVEQTDGGAVITITDVNGTTTADVARGMKGDKGDPGEQGPKGDKGDTGATGPQGIQGETGPQGERGEKGEAGEQGPKGDPGETGATGPQGEVGPAGTDGTSCTHSWDGTVLTVTSASGTSSSDLIGPQGPQGPQGETGPAGESGTEFAPVAPLSLEDGELAVDLSAYTATEDLPNALWAKSTYPRATGTTHWIDIDYTYALKGMRAGDFVFSGKYRTLSRATNVYANTSFGGRTSAIMSLVADLGAMRKFETTTAVDAEPGATVEAVLPAGETCVIPAGCVFLNTETGNLMLVGAEAVPENASTTTPVTVTGLCNLFSADVPFTAQPPLSLEGETLSIDLSDYARSDDLPQSAFDATVYAGLGEEGASVEFSMASFSDLYRARVGDFVYDTQLDRLGVVTSAEPREDVDGVDLLIKTIYDFGKLRGIVTTTALDVGAGETGSGTAGGAGHTVRAGTLVLNTETGSLMVATSTASPRDAASSPTVQVEGIGNVLAPDLSGYAALSGAAFTGAVSGVAPTADAHFATKGYVDGAIPDLTGYATKQYVDQAIPAISASSPLSYADGVLSIDLSAYATKQFAEGLVPDLSGYATKGYVDGKVAEATPDLSSYATKQYVDDAIPSLSGYATEQYVTNALSGYATQQYVGNAVSGLASTGYVDNAVSGLASTSYVDNAVSGAAPDLSGYATQAWVTQQIEAALADFANLEDEEF